MAYDLLLHPRAQRELDRAPAEMFKRLDAAVRSLADNPRPVGVKKLEGDLHRIRLGDWRVVFAVLDQERRVVVLRVARRSEKTYKNLS